MNSFKLILLIFIFYCQGLSGQIYFQRTYGFSTINKGSSIVSGFDGGYLIAGTTSINNSDFYIIKLLDDGSIQWQKTYGGLGIDQAFSIAIWATFPFYQKNQNIFQERWFAYP